jgi:2-hydroxy-6-oxo-6-(2'-carboxyphenyl)-hexa-2,4-dienoate hydrolase
MERATMSETAGPIADGLDQSKLRFVDVDGVRTRYYEDGAGDPLVLMSGGEFFGSLYSLDAWSLNLPVLARDFHVLALDKLGQGHTDNPRSEAEYTFEALVQHTYDWLRAVGLTSGVHLVGHSRGALLAAVLALEYPGLVKSTVIVDSSTLAPEDPRYPSLVFYAEVEKRIPPGPPSPATVRAEADAQAFNPAQVTDDFVGRMYQIALLPQREESQRRRASVAPNVWMPSLTRRRQETVRIIEEQGLPTRTLVIWGFNDRSAPLPLGVDLFSRICQKTAQAEMHILRGAGHYSYRDQYEAFNRTLTSYCLG